MNYYYFAGAVILMLVGLVGVVFPAIPGIPLMALVGLAYHFFINSLPTWALVSIIIITALSILIDYLSGILGSKYAGASGKSMLLGFVGMILFIGAIPPIGPIIGLFLGILAGELIFKKEARKALKTAGAGAFSVLLGMMINLILAIGLITIFIFGAL